MPGRSVRHFSLRHQHLNIYVVYQALHKAQSSELVEAEAVDRERRTARAMS